MFSPQAEVSNSPSQSQDNNNNNNADVTNSQLQELNSPYNVISRISSGAYGIVYKGRIANSSTYVAIKKIRIPTNTDGVSVSVLREISLIKHLSKFKHPNIVGFHDICTVSPSQVLQGREFLLYMIFEFVNQDLDSFIKNSTPDELNVVKIKGILHQIFKGIDFLHSQRILHRDLKPENLLITPEGQVKVADFGLSKIYDFSWKLSNGVVTLWYRAPEVLLGASYGSAVDMWSIGCIFAELYRLKALFRGTSEKNQLEKIFQIVGTPENSDWPSDSKLVPGSFHRYSKINLKMCVPGICSTAENLLNQLLEFKPEERISAMDALQHPYFQSHVFGDPLSTDEINEESFRKTFITGRQNNGQTRKRKLSAPLIPSGNAKKSPEKVKQDPNEIGS